MLIKQYWACFCWTKIWPFFFLLNFSVYINLYGITSVRYISAAAFCGPQKSAARIISSYRRSRNVGKVTPCASWLQWLSCTARKRNLPTGFGNSRIWCCTSVLMDLDTVTLVYCPERNLPTGFGNSRTWCLYECVVSKSEWWLDVAWWEKLSLKTLTAKKQTPSVKIDTVTGAPDCSFNYVCYNR